MNDLTKVMITAPAYTFTAIPHWVALDKGFFREEGLDVSMDFVPGMPKDVWDKDRFPMYEGRVLFHAPGTASPFSAARQGRVEVNVICTQDRAPHVLVARSDIKDVTDLRSKRIMAGTEGASYIDAKIALKHFGVDPDKEITWVPSEDVPPDTERSRVIALEKGEVDAICSGPPHWYIAEKKGFRRLTSARDIERRIAGGVTTTPRVIEERPEVVKAMVRGLIRGTEFARLNREETVDTILRHVTYVDRDTAAGCYDVLRDQWIVPLDDEPYIRHVDLYHKEYNVKEPRPWQSYFDHRFVREAMAEMQLVRPKPERS